MMLFVPLWFAGLMINFPDNIVWVLLSIFPFTAPVQVMLRLGVSDVPPWQILTSIVVLGLFIILSLSFSTKIFRTFMLIYGKRPGLSEIIQGLKTA
jgi:ABC-2 type transport system permease protein